MDIALRAIALYVFVVFVMRMVGRRELFSKNLRRERITPDDLAEEMRTQQIAAFDQVQWAILESNGTISFIQKAS